MNGIDFLEAENIGIERGEPCAEKRKACFEPHRRVGFPVEVFQIERRDAKGEGCHFGDDQRTRDTTISAFSSSSTTLSPSTS